MYVAKLIHLSPEIIFPKRARSQNHMLLMCSGRSGTAAQQADVEGPGGTRLPSAQCWTSLRTFRRSSYLFFFFTWYSSWIKQLQMLWAWDRSSLKVISFLLQQRGSALFSPWVLEKLSSNCPLVQHPHDRSVSFTLLCEQFKPLASNSFISWRQKCEFYWGSFAFYISKSFLRGAIYFFRASCKSIFLWK